jgi:DNA polymerase-3 subunit delta'
MPGAAPDILKFSGILGQQKAKELLQRTVSRNKISHAFLFRGAPGVGKKTTAKAFAALINCLTPRNREACGLCSSCRKLKAGSHPDFMMVQPEGAGIKISQIRALRQALTFPPYEGRYRIALLTDIHTMRREAANSMLKTLEEPPPDTVLILTGEEATGILPTILSRCQVIPFYPLPVGMVAEALVQTRDLAPEPARTLAAVAEGSLGRAELLLETDLLTVRQEIIEKLTRLEPDDPRTIETVYQLAETAARLKENLPELLELLKSWLHDLTLTAHGITENLMNRDLLHSHPATGRRWNLMQLSAKIQKIAQAEKQLNRNCNRALICEVLFFGLL